MRRLILLCLLATAPAASFAVPVSYDLIYTSDYGPSGVGSAIWDGDNHLLSEFTWDLGVGRVGGFVSSALAGVGPIIWELASGDTTASPESSVAIGFFPTSVYGYGSLGLGLTQNGHYKFVDAQYEDITGVITASARSTGGGGVAVPEPTSLALFSLGLIGLAFARRRKR